MQSLWSRAGQGASRCGCRACSTAVNTVGRRAAAGARRRKPTFAEVFTACYSSMFATAAIVDAVHKEDRRRDLDRQLDEARRELNDLQQNTDSAFSGQETMPKDLSVRQMDALWRGLKTIYRNRPYMKEIHRPATISASDLVESLKQECFHAPTVDSLRSRRRTNYELLERAIQAEEVDGSIRLRGARSQLQLSKESASVERLVQHLLRGAEIKDKTSQRSPSFDEARGLSDTGFPNFTFPSIDPERAAANTVSLNQRLRALVADEKLGLKEKIGRVCYNLLISSHPPDIHTYNTLIVAFDKSGLHSFARPLVDSFFHKRLLQPTPSTFAAIIDHYKVVGDHGKFLRALACMTGLDGRTGAKSGRRHVDDVKNVPAVGEWAANSVYRTQTGDWVWQHAPLNLPLVDTILSAFMHFKLFDEAAAFFLSCLRSGIALSTSIVTQLLDECIAALDWRSSVRLVRGVSTSIQWWDELLAGLDEMTASEVANKFMALVYFVGVGGDRQPATEHGLQNLKMSRANLDRLMAHLRSVSPQTCDADHEDQSAAQDMAVSKRRVLQLEGLYKEYETVRKTAASIESKLLYPEFSYQFRAGMAMHIGESAIGRSLGLRDEFFEAIERRGRLPRQGLQTSKPPPRQASDVTLHYVTNDVEGTTTSTASQKTQLREAATTPTTSLGWGGQSPMTMGDLCIRPKHLLGWRRDSGRERMRSLATYNV